MPLILPFTSTDPSYRVGTTLDGQTYLFDVRWNAFDEAWYFDLLLDDETSIASGVKILIGLPLARRATHAKRPPGAIIVSDLTGQERDAGVDDLGTRVIVYYYTAAEFAAL